MITFTLQLLYTKEKSSWYSMNIRVGWNPELVWTWW
jgi:hypothetical protein